jgi:DnaJ domain
MATTANQKNLTVVMETEIQRLVESYGYDTEILTSFANFILNPPKAPKAPKAPKSKIASTAKKVKAPTPLSLPQLKKAVLEHFQVKDLTALRKSATFQMATSGMGKLEASKKDGWEAIYRKSIGILPGEDSETGDGCINGINIFKYDMPWKAFGLDPKTSTTDDIKTAYRELCQIYHPDKSTGNSSVFDRLTTFYKSLIETF